MRKVVYWRTQNVTEAFQYSELHGWVPTPLSDSQWWVQGSYDYYEIMATDAQFATRKDGCVIG